MTAAQPKFILYSGVRVNTALRHTPPVPPGAQTHLLWARDKAAGVSNGVPAVHCGKAEKGHYNKERLVLVHWKKLVKLVAAKRSKMGSYSGALLDCEVTLVIKVYYEPSIPTCSACPRTCTS